jgi:hypothetical protein
MLLESTPLEPASPDAADEQQQQSSPVEAIISIRKDLAKFQRTGTPCARRREKS